MIDFVAYLPYNIIKNSEADMKKYESEKFTYVDKHTGAEVTR